MTLSENKHYCIMNSEQKVSLKEMETLNKVFREQEHKLAETSEVTKIRTTLSFS